MVVLCIEYDGAQYYHSRHQRHLDPERKQFLFNEVKRRDALKNEFCKTNNIDLLRLKYIDVNKQEQIKELKEKIINYIKNKF